MVTRILIALALLVSAPLAGAAQGNPNFFEREISGASVELVLSQLQNAIDEAGFTFMRVQNVDKGLAAKGFDRPPYKIVFFGDREAFEKAREIDPRVTPYLPLKITLYEDEAGNSHLSVVDPAVVGRMFNPGLQEQFQDWSRRMQQILDTTTEEVEGSTFSP
ncbi:hypothetical protein AN478_06340 [Thiohalorhabdus denitrificans]|uniref:Uncharacterized conserved protein, DUF302 family n=1 Tax=Thiohalorhabdus denitrificans TaxID=381306 RepID=A0A0N8PN34_9GAMM|nr:DUF302 domain-containing protein [Thiohalorhabdus denitrificans]KPV40413.1 hypothetical protein AN478_06340 [Thiohalorhabdus denitrificans]SCY60088.1 Uncharacterized conserved protein, DUF302 family [Thiohalorhabdus denitrificans]